MPSSVVKVGMAGTRSGEMKRHEARSVAGSGKTIHVPGPKGRCDVACMPAGAGDSGARRSIFQSRAHADTPMREKSKTTSHDAARNGVRCACVASHIRVQVAESTNWAFPENLQPAPEEVGFDLAAALDAVVSVRAEIPEDAFTASILGTERLGNGVVIREDGLILTIGYLITEAQTIWLTTNSGAVVAGHPLAYDQVTGFGLVQPLGRLKAP